jgi:hypothetical protein
MRDKGKGKKPIMHVVAVFPKENTEEEKSYLADCLLSLAEHKRPLPPRPPEWEEGREVVEVTKEFYSDGTSKTVDVRETKYLRTSANRRSNRNCQA